MHPNAIRAELFVSDTNRNLLPHATEFIDRLKSSGNVVLVSGTRMWAVTIVGAPKKAAAQQIENLERTPRGWYGGAVGALCLNGDINTGILIRTIHVRDNRAEYPVGATLLYDSVPEMEERETRLKATGFFGGG